MAREPLYPPTKPFPRLPSIFLLLTLAALFLFSTSFLFTSPSSSTISTPLRRRTHPLCSNATADLTHGFWIRRTGYENHSPPLYDASCPFHRNAWNCIRNARENMEAIKSWVWIPDGCGGSPMPRIDPAAFLAAMRGRRIGFVGDSLNENFVVAFICALRSADPGARKWKRKGAWRGGYFPQFDFTVAYHRAVLLAKYMWQPVVKDGVLKGGFYRVDVDIPADDWANITQFYDVLVFNTGHWWGLDKFPKETPLIFYKDGKPIVPPPIGILDGLQVVLESMISYIDRQVPSKKIVKIWRTQSPTHFYGGEWNKNGSCLFTEPLKLQELDSWFDPSKNVVNKEAREVNLRIKDALIKGTTHIQLLDLTHLSEFRADAHPAIWLGKKDAVSIWGQDCMHWCLPGLPDTWVDILSAQILSNFDQLLS